MTIVLPDTGTVLPVRWEAAQQVGHCGRRQPRQHACLHFRTKGLAECFESVAVTVTVCVRVVMVG